MRQRSFQKVRYYTSDLLDQNGVKHGFFTRLGGVSASPFDSLNVKFGVGDPAENVIKNRLLMCQSIGCDSKKLTFAKLAHGSALAIVDMSHAGADIDATDALITQTKNLPIGLSVADCVPIILADPTNQLVAVIHGGWRSLVAGIIPKSVNFINQQLKTKPTTLIAAIGPAISADAYEVGVELIAAVQTQAPELAKFLIKKGLKTHFDLRAAAAEQLSLQKINQIDHVAIDTFTNPNEFYSYRAEGLTGRFGVIVAA